MIKRSFIDDYLVKVGVGDNVHEKDFFRLAVSHLQGLFGRCRVDLVHAMIVNDFDNAHDPIRGLPIAIQAQSNARKAAYGIAVSKQ